MCMLDGHAHRWRSFKVVRNEKGKSALTKRARVAFEEAIPEMCLLHVSMNMYLA